MQSLALVEAQAWLRTAKISVGSVVHVATRGRCGYEAVYVGLATTEHDTVAVVRMAEDEVLHIVHYSRLSLIK